MQISGKVVIVTGAASGLGKGAAELLAAQGAQVVVADTQEDRGLEVAHAIDGAFVRCDVAHETDAARTVRLACSMGKLMGLVNCAGIAPAERTLGKAGPHRLDAFSRALNVNLLGSFNMIRLAADAMSRNAPEATGERGCMISTASIAAYEGQVGQAAYAASKGGIVGMTLPIARDLGRLGIRNMAVAPGLFGTPMLLAQPAQVREALAASVPFPARLGTPRDFARLVLHIFENEMLNGEVIRLDGAVRLPGR
ncbi:MAG TPA: SDR family NAD(P)-dependent oxidoreductase [Ramlibacter sp.]|nr:SDR family NAD(P)-dependent oxidoreductase [Ramlibacter sp.]